MEKSRLIKFIDSLNEQIIRKQLISSHDSLFQNLDESELYKVLKDNFPEMKTAYTIYWIPEQGEDLYRVLINTSVIAVVEINRHDKSIKPIVKSIPIDRYIKGLKKRDQIELTVALELASQDLKNND